MTSNRRAALGEPGNCTPAVVIWKCWKSNAFFLSVCERMGVGNHKGLSIICQYRERNGVFLTHIATLFRTPGQIPWADKLFHPEALFTAICTALTEWMILPSSIPAQEELPFQMPFLASAHRSSRSGASRLGVSTFGCLSHSCRAASNLPRTEERSKSLGSAATAKARVPLPMIRKRRSSE